MSSPDPIHVIGHRNPDTDAICSAIGYAAFLRDSRGDNAVPARCGELSVRTAWALSQAGVTPPKLLMDVRPTAATICHRNVIVAQRGETFLSVYRKMIEHSFRSIPVVDDAGRMVGMPTLLELAQLFMPATAGDADANRQVRTSEANMLTALNGTFPNGLTPHDEVENLILMVAGSSLETSQSRLGRFPKATVVFLTGDRPDVQRMAIQHHARCLVITGGFTVDADIADLAQKHNVPVIQTRYDTASAAQLVRFSRPIADALHDDFLRFRAKTPLKEIIAAVHDSHQPIFPVIDEEGDALLGVFSKSDLVDPPRA
ncbi:MAG: DRTGG domain-containing protein, partial [Verrucomicrobiaceae bacterium]